MNYQFALKWLRAFREGPEATLAMYADKFLFEDEPLDAAFTEKEAEAFARFFAPFNNQDPTNGMGIHNFQIKDYLGDEKSGCILWTWTASHCDSFAGIPTNGTTIQTDGHSWQVYNDEGRITRESAYWDPIPVLIQLGQPVTRDIATQSAWPFSLSAQIEPLKGVGVA